MDQLELNFKRFFEVNMQKKRTYYEIIKVFAFTARLSNLDKNL